MWPPARRSRPCRPGCWRGSRTTWRSRTPASRCGSRPARSSAASAATARRGGFPAGPSSPPTTPPSAPPTSPRGWRVGCSRASTASSGSSPSTAPRRAPRRPPAPSVPCSGRRRRRPPGGGATSCAGSPGERGRLGPVRDRARHRLARRAAALTAAGSFAAVIVLAAALVPWSWVPGGPLVPKTAEQLFTAPQIARSERYAHLQRLLGWSSYFLSLGALVLLCLTPLGARLLRRLAPFRHWWIAVPAGALVVLVLGRLVGLPFSIASHRVDLDYGISRQGW